ncbi:MAG TPA: NAD-dependent epimerase/dehydratase family protein [Oligoflexus sp.]|uniref:NAD-dependent epimerase/dehydratase family protein n=1 Tax=Oligoflexus sp. TaxID=1971216 RepID=UPI002D285A34|nr:NAD-dependent epimerase/dehydratase family protein [Oligoflexus sp.]HYX33202.1 NAD-dependent epimerase/dehydratase family protein [Oligoflexus sp.]
MRILVIGGAGFVGSSLALSFQQSQPNSKIVVFDNLHRRGSELNLPRFKQHDIEFIHGDIRNREDLEDIPGTFDLTIEASAEPSVHAGQSGQGVNYLIGTNLNGTINFLDFVRKKSAGGVFLSTSRVYSIPALRSIKLDEGDTRFELSAQQDMTGLSKGGIACSFPTVGRGFRSLYGSTKLASELFIEEYAAVFNVNVLVNRCGVIAGPWQFGKTDQGVFTLWVARHLFQGQLSYTGFGGTGKQVRDLLHPRDLFRLIQQQIPVLDKHRGQIFAVGGGPENAVSLKEYTQICEKICGQRLDIRSQTETSPVDIPWFVSDLADVGHSFDWKPELSPESIVSEIKAWLARFETILRPLFT